MAKVKVWNDNQFEHVEEFKGKKISIAPGAFVEMDYFDAVDFKGQFIPPKMRGPNDPDPRFFKKIRVEEPTEAVIKEDPNVFHATGKKFESEADVLAFAKAYAVLNPSAAVKDEGLDRHSNAEMAKELAALREEVAAMQNRAKPGPKPKQRATA